MLTGLFWGAVDSFAGLFDGFYYIFTGESTSKADKFDNLRSIKILNTPLTQKSPGISTKRHDQEQNLQTKKGAISRPWRMNVDRDAEPQDNTEINDIPCSGHLQWARGIKQNLLQELIEGTWHSMSKCLH